MNLNPEQKTAALEKEVADLKKRMDALSNVATIPYNVDRAFNDRGFSKVKIVTGTGSIPVAGLFTLSIPGATSESIALVSHAIDSPVGAVLECGIIAIGNEYGIAVQGTATEEFNFVVFIGAPLL